MKACCYTSNYVFWPREFKYEAEISVLVRVNSTRQNEPAFGIFVEKRLKSKTICFMGQKIQMWSLNVCICERCARARQNFNCLNKSMLHIKLHVFGPRNSNKKLKSPYLCALSARVPEWAYIWRIRFSQKNVKKALCISNYEFFWVKELKKEVNLFESVRVAHRFKIWNFFI